MSFLPTRPFDLPLLPPKAWTGEAMEKEVSRPLLQAVQSLAELKGYTPVLPDPKLLLFPELLRESIASNEIEAIHTTLDDAFQQELFPEKERRPVDQEVLNYRQGLLWGEENLGKLALSTRLIQGVHSHILGDSRGGKYRRQQNGIAKDSTGEIIYTPPAAPALGRLLSNWENFANDDGEEWHPLIRAILCHYQFEAIHPFSDGNGRTGRILFVLQLMDSGSLHYPVLYLSGYLAQHRSQYYQALNRVSSHDDWAGWVRFMLTAVAVQAEKTKTTLFGTMNLLEQAKAQIGAGAPKIYSADLVAHIFANPYTIPSRLAEAMGIHYVTAAKYLDKIEGLGWLKSRRSGKYHLYSNHRLLELLRGKPLKDIATSAPKKASK